MTVELEMETHPIHDDGQPARLVAFAIENAYVGPVAVARILRTIEGVGDVRVRKIFRRPFDIQVRFEYLGVPHEVVEPWGDSSIYEIGPSPSAVSPPDIGPLEEVFRAHRLSWWRQAAGDIITLKFAKRFFQRAK